MARVLYSRSLILASAISLVTAVGVRADETVTLADHAAKLQFFEQKIQPVLVAKCYGCHSRDADELEGGLLLDSRDGTRAGGDSGAAVVPGNLDGSLLFEAINGEDSSMPPDGPLPPTVVEDFRAWILSGAIDPRESDDAAEMIRDYDYSEAREYWAFQPVEVQAVPSINHTQWARTPIDHFILEQLESRGLRPSPIASPSALIRRLYFDLTGLPPTPQQVDEFVEDPSEHNYKRIVDRILDSPHYGERWAQHWLDLVRYAETEGFEYDRTMPDLWRYRDYVIESFNEDKPYDEFLREQLAGDEIDPDDHTLLVAAGFHRLGTVRRNSGNQKVASSRNEVLTERTDIIGSAILGLSVGCARCHDHKFDPISQHDYYRLQAFFGATAEHNISLQEEAEREKIDELRKSLEAQILKLKTELSNLTEAEEQPVRDKIEELQSKLPPVGPTLCSIKNDFESASPIRLLRRGDPELPGPVVGMRSPGALVPDAHPELPHGTPNPRTQLAIELTDPNHPLTARVMVNRIWQHHFGNGLVRTPNDFGKNGSAPSHPALLDYLSARFVADGWRLKPIHRAIVTSSVYRQSSRANEEAQAIDPENRLLAYFPRRRLSGEEIRDAMLSMCGVLNPQMGGQSVIVPVEKELVDQLYKMNQWVVTAEQDQHNRRSVYLFAKRNLRLPFMEVFDQPTAQTSCAVREQSTHARQALELLNGDFANRIAEKFAERLTREAKPGAANQAELAYRLAAGRPPSPRELELAERFIQEVGLREFALAMFNVNAFLYVD